MDGVVDQLAAHPQDQFSAEESVPRWMQRLFLVVFVAICLELGLILVVVPWSAAWKHNSLINSYPALHFLLQNSFVKGMISGIGLLDLWIGISQAVSYREK